MSNHQTLTRKSTELLRLLALVCLTLGLAVPAAAQCKTGKLELPDLATLKLPDGEHTIKAVELGKGKLEVRVNVKGKVVSDPILYFRGKPMKKTPDSEISKPLRDCLEKTAKPSGSQFGNAARFILGRIAPTAYAAPFYACLVFYSCDDRYCCATVCCQSMASCERWCAPIKQ